MMDVVLATPADVTVLLVVGTAVEVHDAVVEELEVAALMTIYVAFGYAPSACAGWKIAWRAI